MGKIIQGFIAVYLLSQPSLAEEIPAICIDRAKQAAHATLQGCITEQKVHEIDVIRDRYHQKLEELRHEYEQELRQFRPPGSENLPSKTTPMREGEKKRPKPKYSETLLSYSPKK